MSLALTLDYGLPVVAEAGYYQAITSRELAERGFLADATSHQGIWRDEPTKTVMLRPLQLREDWLDTANQLDSILRLPDLVVNATDAANNHVFEAPVFGNNANPWIFHSPVGPGGAFIGDAPGMIGVSTPDLTTGLEALSHVASSVFAAVTGFPDPLAPPAASLIGGIADSKVIAHSATRLSANQGLYLRWFHPPGQVGLHTLYIFYVGNYAIHIRNVVVQVYRDTSSAGDRSSWKKVLTAPLFSTGDTSVVGGGTIFAPTPPAEVLHHDRALLFLPFRRNQILLHSSAGKWAVLTVNGQAKRQGGGLDWDITRSDSVQVRVLTTQPGRFQIQKLKYPTGTIKVQIPPAVLDYTPASAPVLTISSDTDHGTGTSGVVSGPPSYTLPTNDATDCAPRTTVAALDQKSRYGVVLSLTASSDHRWTPFLYAIALTRGRTFGANPATPITIHDTVAAGTHLASVTLTSGRNPGEGRMVAEVWDMYSGSAYPLASRSGRSGFPLQLVDGSTVLFTGISEPAETTPIKQGSGPVHRITFPAMDRWKQLLRGLMRDNRDWTGFGHIDAVKHALEQGGVDTTSAEWPAGYTPGVISTVNTALGIAALTQDTKQVKQGWAPHDDDTPASFIKRIAEIFSGWWVGFRLDGTPFYLPRTYFTTPTVTFASSRTGSSPYFYDPLTFTIHEPEANSILVKCGDTVNGAVRYSSLWVDWASILNPSAPNFLGWAKRLVIVIGGTYGCAQLNTIARRIWERTRRRITEVRFEADFVPSLGVGHVCTLGSEGDYRITGFEVTMENAAHHRARYTAEFIGPEY